MFFQPRRTFSCLAYFFLILVAFGIESLRNTLPLCASPGNTFTLSLHFNALTQQVSLPFPQKFFTESAAIFVHDAYVWIVLSHPKHQWHIQPKAWPTTQVSFPAHVHDTGVYWKIPLPRGAMFSDYKTAAINSIEHLMHRDTLDTFLSCTPNALHLSKKKAPHPPVILQHKGEVLHIFTTHHPRGGHYTPQNFVFCSVLQSLQGWVIRHTSPYHLQPWKQTSEHWALPYPRPLSSYKDRYTALNHKILHPDQEAFGKTLWSYASSSFEAPKNFMDLPAYMGRILYHLSHAQGSEATHMLNLAFQQFPALREDGYAQLLQGIALYLQGNYAQALSIFLCQDLPPERHFWYGLCLTKFPQTLHQGWDILHRTFHILRWYPAPLQIFLGQNIVHLALDFHHQTLALQVLKILHALEKNASQKDIYRTLQERYVHHISSFSLDNAMLWMDSGLFSPKIHQYLKEFLAYDLDKLSLEKLKNSITQLLLIRHTWKNTVLEAKATYCLSLAYEHLKEYPKALEMWKNWHSMPLKIRSFPEADSMVQNKVATCLEKFLNGPASSQDKIRLWQKYQVFDTFSFASKEKILTHLIETARPRYFYDQLFPLLVRTISGAKVMPLLWITTLVELYHKKGQVPQALIFLDRLLPTHTIWAEEINILRAKSWLKLKRPTDALHALRFANSISGQSLYFHILTTQKNWKELERYSDKILKKTLHAPGVLYRILAAIHQKKWQDIPILRQKYFSFMVESPYKEIFLTLTYHFDRIENLYDLQNRLQTWHHLRRNLLSFYNNVEDPFSFTKNTRVND